MAMSLGIGLVFGCSYEMLEDIKLIPIFSRKYLTL